MKIGILTNTFPKFSETFVLDHIIGLLDRGHEVSIFAFHEPDDTLPQHPSVREYNLHDRTIYLTTPDSSSAAVTETARNGMQLAMNAPASAKPIIQTARKKGLRRAGGVLHRLPKLLQAGLDILHAHFGYMGRWAARFHQAGVADAFVVSFHGWGLREAAEQGASIYTTLFDQADRLLANTRSTREQLIKYGADPDRVTIQHIGIDSDTFQPNGQSHNSETITVLTVARLHEAKGLKYGIRAVENLSQRCPDIDIQYRIVGGGPLEDELRELIRTNNLGDLVTLCGPLDQPGVVDELHSADIFLLPSVNEGFGKVLLEAQASELPIVASEVGGIPEAVRPDESALLVPSRDVGAITDQLATLVRNPAMRTEFGAAGRANVRQNFDNDVLNDDLETLYRGLV